MILITGSNGFLGSALARTLVSAGRQVRCVGRRPRPADLEGADYVQCDLELVQPDSSLFQSVTTIVHLAWTTVPATSLANIEQDATSNIGMTLRLLAAARVQGISSFIFGSSGGAVYGRPARLPARETDPTEPLSPYGVAKLAAEKYVALHAHLYGIRGVSLRIANPYGAGQLRGTPIGVIARLLQDIDQDLPFTIWGDGRTVRDFLHIDDLLKAFQHAITDRSLESGVYNVGSGHGASLTEVIAMAADITGKAPIVRYEGERAIDVPQIYVDSDRFSSATGWQPTIRLRSGMSRLWKELQEGSSREDRRPGPRSASPPDAERKGGRHAGP
jgi:UDP-glucose 4-epimerase